MQRSAYTVYIVEDDPAVRDSLGLLLGIRGHSVALFADAESLLQAYRPDWCGCLLIDMRMPGMDGLELQRHLLETGCRLPVIVMTGHGDVVSARDAFRAQAVDFLEKPIDQIKLMSAIDEAFARVELSEHDEGKRIGLTRMLSSLTPREREVMDLVVDGRHNREIAEALGISARTVEVHKARMMTKLNADGVSQLVRISLGMSGRK